MKAILASLTLLLSAVLPASAAIVSRTVTYEHAGVMLKGYLAYDDAKVAAGKLPGVLVVHENRGLNPHIEDIARRLALASPEDRRVVRTPLDVVEMLGPDVVNLEREHLHVVLLSTKHHVIGVRELYRGTLNSSVVRVGELFRHAIREDAAAIIVAHNHPSGDPAPSPEDVRITTEAVAAGRLMEGVVAHARARALKIVPTCGYAVSWFRHHPEHTDILS